MKVNLPYWKKLPDSWRQFFVALGAIIAVLQAIHFIVVTPVGIIESIKYRSQVETYLWQSRQIAAVNQIAADILGRRNFEFSLGGYYDECMEIVESYGQFMSSLVDSSRCDNVDTLEEIINSSIEHYEVPEGEIPYVYETLEWQLGLPKEKMGRTE